MKEEFYFLPTKSMQLMRSTETVILIPDGAFTTDLEKVSRPLLQVSTLLNFGDRQHMLPKLRFHIC